VALGQPAVKVGIPIVQSSEAMPGWMQHLFSKFTQPDTHLNVRLFIGKIIINRPSVFQVFASQWLRLASSFLSIEFSSLADRSYHSR
jgi:DNA-dependent protein kinase catalytic subunit